MTSIDKIKSILLEILFPHICLNCKQVLSSNLDKEMMLCTKCFQSIHFFQDRIHLANNITLISLGSYKNGALRELIHNLKYKGVTQIEIALQKLLDDFLQTILGMEIVENDFIVPIPLHRKREKERGFNQAKLIAQILSSKTHIPLLDTLERTRNTRQQTNIKNYSKRESNMLGAFATTNKKEIFGKSIVLVDDVYTSGATAKEAAKELCQNGSGKITILSLARIR